MLAALPVLLEVSTSTDGRNGITFITRALGCDFCCCYEAAVVKILILVANAVLTASHARTAKANASSGS